jgi:hypothetical protein
MRKQPRDFVHVDEFWPADKGWPHYYFRHQVWVFADEYRAELAGDQSYSRIVIHAGDNSGWLFSRPLAERDQVKRVLSEIQRPVSWRQLAALGFERWQGEFI